MFKRKQKVSSILRYKLRIDIYSKIKIMPGAVAYQKGLHKGPKPPQVSHLKNFTQIYKLSNEF